MEGQAVVDTGHARGARPQDMPTLAIRVVDDGIEHGQAPERGRLLVDEADVVPSGSLALRHDVPALGHGARLDDVDGGRAAVDLHPRLKASRSHRSVLPPHRHRHQAPPQGPVDDVGRHLTAPESARGEVP